MNDHPKKAEPTLEELEAELAKRKADYKQEMKETIEKQETSTSTIIEKVKKAVPKIAKKKVVIDKPKAKVKKDTMRYKIERYSPARDGWHYFGEVFPRKKDAEDRIKILHVRHMAQELQFRVVPIEPTKP